MYQYVIFPLFAFIGGLTQAVTGFGCGIIMMMALPFFFDLPVAAGISGACGCFISGYMAYKYRKNINYKKMLFPAVLFVIVSSIMIFISTSLNQVVMKKVFGVFLIILCVYYLFFNKGKKQNLSLAIKILFVVISALCDALFGIGGPLMVLYFLASTDDMKEYLSTLQAFFICISLYNTIFRVANGIITISVLPMIAAGIAGIFVGAVIGGKIIEKLNPALIKKLTYIMIGVAGIINIV